MTDEEMNTIVEAVRSAVAEAMHDDDGHPRRALPTHQALTAEWRLTVTAKSGPVYSFDPVATEAEAEATARHFKHGKTEIQRRLVSDWTTVPPPPGADRRD